MLPTNLSVDCYRQIYRAFRTEAVKFFKVSKWEFDHKVTVYLARTATVSSTEFDAYEWCDAASEVLEGLEARELNRLEDASDAYDNCYDNYNYSTYYDHE